MNIQLLEDIAQRVEQSKYATTARITTYGLLIRMEDIDHHYNSWICSWDEVNLQVVEAAIKRLEAELDRL